MKKKILALLMAGVMALGLAACGGGDSEGGSSEGATTLNMATGGTSGTYYAFSGVVANTLNGKLEGVSINVESSGASGANIDMIDTGNDQLAILQNEFL